MDLSPLSNNTQPSPKDSGVDVSSPPRREDDPCYGGGGTTPLQTSINAPHLVHVKPKFFSCDRKKNVNLAELQAKELRKIIYDPRERKRKNTISLAQTKTVSTLTKQNYSIVPNDTKKQSNIVLKISSDYKKIAKDKNNIDEDKFSKYNDNRLENSNNLYRNKNKIEDENKKKDKKVLEIKSVGGLKIKLSLISSKQVNLDELEIKRERKLNKEIQSSKNLDIDLKNNKKLKSKKKKVPTAPLR